MEITRSEVLKVIDYFPDTGAFAWKNPRSNRVKPGGSAGGVNTLGYVQVGLFGKRLLAHRLAWLCHYGEWPEGEIDHIDSDKANNKISNLRLATKSQNSFNRGPTKRSTTGAKGVTFNKRKKRWIAQCMIRGKNNLIGYFDSIEDAALAYEKFATKMQGEFKFPSFEWQGAR